MCIRDRLMEVEEKYDLGEDDMDGFGNEGEEESSEDSGIDAGGSDSYEE